MKYLTLWFLLLSTLVFSQNKIIYEDHFFTNNKLVSGYLGFDFSNGEIIHLSGDIGYSFKVCGKKQKYFCFISELFNFSIPKDNLKLNSAWSFDGFHYLYQEDIVRSSYKGNQDIKVIKQVDRYNRVIYFFLDDFEVIGFSEGSNFKSNKLLFMAVNEKGFDFIKINKILDKNSKLYLNKTQFDLLLLNKLEENDFKSMVKRTDCLIDNKCSRE